MEMETSLYTSALCVVFATLLEQLKDPLFEMFLLLFDSSIVK